MSHEPNLSPAPIRAGGTRDGGTMPEGTKRISLDWWTVLAALAAAVLVKAGVLPAIPW
jgi:hypothetical protein